MKLFIMFTCLCATIFSFRTYGQDTSKRIGRPIVDSILPTTNIKALENQLPLSSVKQQLKDAGNLLKDNPLEEVSSKVKLFDKNDLLKTNTVVVDANYNYLYDTSIAFNGLRGSAGYNIAYGASVKNLPINLQFKGNDGVYAFNQTGVNDFYKLNFDHEKYMESLKAKVLEKISAEKAMEAGMKRLNSIKDEYQQSLNKEILDIKSGYEKKYGKVLQLPSDINNISVNDISSLRSRVIPDSVYNKYSQGAQQYQELLKNPPSSDSLQRMSTNALKADAEQYEALQKVYSKVLSYKDKFENNKIVKELRSNLPFNASNYKSFLSKPGNLEDVIKNNAEISSLQRLFMSVTKLDVGQNPVQSGDFGFKNVVNKGINTEFQTKANSFGLIYGKNNTSSQWLQQGLTSTVNDYTSVAGIKFGSGSASPIKQNVSLNFFDFNNNSADQSKIPGGRGTDYLPVAKHKDIVLSYSTSFSLGIKHKIGFDISKSFGSFQNTYSSDSTAVTNKSALSNKGVSDIGGKVNYEGEILKTDITAFVKKVGLGYNNPGNVNLRRGESQVGLAIARKFYKQRINIRIASDYKKQKFDPFNNYSYSAFNNKVTAGYKFNRNSRINITYQSSKYVTKMADAQNNGGNTSRFQLDGSYSYKLFNKKIINNAVISNQKQNIPTLDSANYKNKSFMIMHTSSVVLNKNILSLSLLMNRAKSEDYLFNTSMFNAEANYAYSVAKKMKLSSGAGFYANAGWNQQIGIKQQCSTQLIEKLNIDFELGYKKAIKIIKPEFANQLFGTVMMHYSL